MRLTAIGLLVVLACTSCGSQQSGSLNASSCAVPGDSIFAVSETISTGGTGVTANTCKALSANAEADATSPGGIGAVTLVNAAWCRFTQVPASSSNTGAKAKSPKPGEFISRPPNALFEIREAKADCTVNVTDKIHLCGFATLMSTSSVPFRSSSTCNRDPGLEVDVYQGKAMLQVEGPIGARTFRLEKGQSLGFDLSTGIPIAGKVTPDADLLAVFAAQGDAMVGGFPVADTSAFLAARNYPASDWILAPDTFASQLAGYGKAGPMCDFVNGDAVFYPMNPTKPTLYGTSCRGKSIVVHGIAIYQPQNVLFAGGKYFATDRGLLVQSALLDVTLKEKNESLVYDWNGSVSPISIVGGLGSKARPDIYYVAHVTYSVLPDITPRVALVAISFGGARFPPNG